LDAFYTGVDLLGHTIAQNVRELIFNIMNVRFKFSSLQYSRTTIISCDKIAREMKVFIAEEIDEFDS
jgi:hypothetical protein